MTATKRRPPGRADSPDPTAREVSAAASAAFSRPLPHRPDAEKAVLGSCLLEPHTIADARLIIREPEAFFFKRNRVIWGLMLTLADSGKPFDGVVIRDELERRGLFESCGGYEYLGDLVNSVASSTRVREYAEIVWNAHLSRLVIRAGNDAIQAALDDRRPGPEYVADLSRETQRLTELAAPIESAEASDDVYDRVMRSLFPAPGEASAEMDCAMTGFYELDVLLGGLRPGVTIVAARPSCGKTAFALDIARNAAVRGGKRVLFVTLEMESEDIIARAIGAECGVCTRIFPGKSPYGPDKTARIERATELLRESPLRVVKPLVLGMSELRGLARREMRKGLKLIVVDYLTLMEIEQRRDEQDWLALSNLVRQIKLLSGELRCPIVVAAQLNRNSEKRDEGRPELEDLGRSDGLVQHADNVILLHPNTAEPNYDGQATHNRRTPRKRTAVDGQATIILAKNRRGPVGDVAAYFHASLASYTEPGQRGGDAWPMPDEVSARYAAATSESGPLF